MGNISHTVWSGAAKYLWPFAYLTTLLSVYYNYIGLYKFKINILIPLKSVTVHGILAFFFTVK